MCPAVLKKTGCYPSPGYTAPKAVRVRVGTGRNLRTFRIFPPEAAPTQAVSTKVRYYGLVHGGGRLSGAHG